MTSLKPITTKKSAEKFSSLFGVLITDRSTTFCFRKKYINKLHAFVTHLLQQTFLIKSIVALICNSFWSNSVQLMQHEATRA